MYKIQTPHNNITHSLKLKTEFLNIFSLGVYQKVIF